MTDPLNACRKQRASVATAGFTVTPDGRVHPRVSRTAPSIVLGPLALPVPHHAGAPDPPIGDPCRPL